MKIVFLVLLTIIVLIIALVLGIRLKDHIHLKQFEQCQKGMNIKQTRKILGNPDEKEIYGGEIMEIYYYFPMGEARFFYNKKDSILNNSWRTDCD